MSKQIKLALLALVALPAFAMLFFWKRPAATGADSSPVPSVQVAHETAPATPPAPTTSPVALPTTASPIVAALPAPPGSTTDGNGEVRARATLRNRPGFLNKGTPVGCDPPFTTDADGNKHYKKECF